MPRKRTRVPTEPKVVDVDLTTATTTNVPTTTTGEVKKMATIDNAKIAALMAGGRNRGAGGQEIKEFLESGEAGVEVSLTTGRFAGKTAKQVQTTLNNARKSSNANGYVFKEGPDLLVRVEKDDEGTEHVYLINPSLYDADE